MPRFITLEWTKIQRRVFFLGEMPISKSYKPREIAPSEASTPSHPGDMALYLAWLAGSRAENSTNPEAT